MSAARVGQIADDAAQQALGAYLARACPAGTVIYLRGDLGAGKTTLVRGFLAGLGHRGRVKSPTYTLIEPYELAGGACYHLDLYRLADPEELEFLGLRDCLDGRARFLVEWPERGMPLLPPADLVVTIHHQTHGRRVELHAVGPRGRELLARLSPDCGLGEPATA